MTTITTYYKGDMLFESRLGKHTLLGGEHGAGDYRTNCVNK